MKHIAKDFERFVEFLEAESRPGGNITDFKTICESLALRRHQLDKFLMREVGLYGEDIVRSYRTATPLPFL